MDPEHQEVQAALETLRSGDDSIFTEDLRIYDASEERYAPDSEHGHRFTINVDFTRPTGELVEFFRRMIDTKREEQKTKTTREREHGVDPWIVWDMAQVPGNAPLRITRALFNMRGNPAEDPETKQFYAQVRRALRTAVSWIEEVGSRRNNTSSQDAFEKSSAIFSSTMAAIVRKVNTEHPP